MQKRACSSRRPLLRCTSRQGDALQGRLQSSAMPRPSCLAASHGTAVCPPHTSPPAPHLTWLGSCAASSFAASFGAPDASESDELCEQQQ